MYLLDTNVISELRRPRPHKAVLQWLAQVPETQIFISAVTVGEIQAGIEIVRERDEDKAEELGAWLDQILASYNPVPMDAAAFRAWARLMHGKPKGLYQDAMIAATALVRGWAVVTRNVRDFDQLGIEIRDPFQDA